MAKKKVILNFPLHLIDQPITPRLIAEQFLMGPGPTRKT
jgi:hypothetical protein